MSNKSQRLTWRARCRRWQRSINAMLALVLALALLLVANPVQAQTTVRCPRPTQPGFYRVHGRTVGVCFVYRPAGVLP